MSNSSQMLQTKSAEKKQVFRGVFLILVGIVILFRKMPHTADLLPSWLFTLPMIPIVLGLYTGIKHGFRNSTWLVLVMIGLFGMFYSQHIVPFELLQLYGLPIAIVLFGLFVIFNRKNI